MERKIREDSIYSQECIIDAFLMLLSENNLQDISVTEICKKAGVARITFYKYYKTINDVLKATVDFKFNEFKEDLIKAKLGGDIKKVLELSITSIVPLRKPLKSLSRSNMSGILLQYFTNALATLLPIIETDVELKKIKYLFLSGGVFNILSDWVSLGMKDTPKKLAEQIYVTMLEYGIINKFGFKKWLKPPNLAYI